MTSDDYFFSLVRPKQDIKKRKCLRCRKPFLSDKYRCCAQCHVVIEKVGPLAVYGFSLPSGYSQEA